AIGVSAGRAALGPSRETRNRRSPDGSGAASREIGNPMSDSTPFLFYAVYLLPLAVASAVAIPLALRARDKNAAALYAFCLAVVVAALSGAGMGMLLGLFGPHQTTWYTPSSMTAEQYGYMGAMIF